MDKLRTRIEFDAVSENEAFARVAAAAFILKADPLVETMEDIKTAVSEAVTNCVIHGYRNSKGRIVMEMELDKEGGSYIFSVVIEDFGVGIKDIAKAREPMYSESSDSERSGMGFTFMELFMDELDVESTVGKGTRVSMKKRIDV